MPFDQKHLVLLICLCLGTLQLHSQTYFLNGDAQFVGDDCYLLTEAISTQNGTVWYADQIDLSEPFDLEFTMNFGTNDQNGADGIVFVLQTVGTSAIGESGGGIGFGGFDPSFGVEFDTWQNGENADLAADHIGMISNGDVSHISGNAISGPVQAAVFNANIEDGLDHVARVVWDPEEQVVEVYFDCDIRLIGNVDLINTIFNGQSLVYWGFTAATGGAWNNQQVCLQENIVSTGPDITICTGSGTTLVASGDPEGEYNWSPEEYLDDPSSQTPFASPPISTMFYVEYFNLCGDPQLDSVFVNVADLEVSATEPEIITCDNPQVTITGSSNFGNDGDYTWETSDGNIVSGENDPTCTVNQSGSYTLLVNVDDLCIDEITVEVSADLTTYTADAGNNATLDCTQSTATLNGSTDGSDAEITWTTNGGNIEGDPSELSITALAAGTYTLNIMNPNNGCNSSDAVTVTDNTYYPIVDAGPADTISCADPFIFLNQSSVEPDEAAQYEWSTIDGLIVNGAATSTPEITEPGMYYLTVTLNSNGCSGTDSVLVSVEQDLFIDFSDLAIPNVFSPNNDGANDDFRPFLVTDPEYNLLAIINEFHLQVFNRWGNKIFERNGSPQGWDGRINGDEAADGAYYYILRFSIECSEQKDFELKGSFELLK